MPLALGTLSVSSASALHPKSDSWQSSRPCRQPQVSPAAPTTVSHGGEWHMGCHMGGTGKLPGLIVRKNRSVKVPRARYGRTCAHALARADFAVFGAAANASVTLFSVCAFIAWMQKTGRLPESTPAVLSQVAFKVLIPCFLFSKVSMTVAAERSSKLLAIPVVAVAQVLLGAALGKAACILVYGRREREPGTFTVSTSTTAPGTPENAASTLSEDNAVPEEERRKSDNERRKRRDIVITTACAFGNSITLPLVFLTAVVGKADTDRMIGYLALFMVGWSPSLWTIGYNFVVGKDSTKVAEGVTSKHPAGWDAVLKTLRRVVNPPLIGVFLGMLVGATPLSHFFLPTKVTMYKPPTALALSSSHWLQAYDLTGGFFYPVVEAAALLGSATLAVQSVVLAASLADSLPPTFGASKATQASSPRLPHHITANPEALLLQEGWSLTIITFVRLILVPTMTAFLLWLIRGAHFLPEDPICTLTLLTQSAMPTAQNLVLLFQLQPKTRPLAPAMAGLLLRQYGIALLPMTLWVTFFKSSISAFTS